MKTYGYNYRFDGTYSQGTVIAPDRQTAWRIVAWILGGKLYPKGSGKTRVHLSINDNPRARQINDQRKRGGSFTI